MGEGSEFFELTPEDLQKMADLSGFELQINPQAPDNDTMRTAPDTDALVRAMASVAITAGPEAFCAFVNDNMGDIRHCAPIDPRVSETLVIGYKMGIENQSATCANNLGSLYYLGDLVEQDYHHARHLYEQAMEWGCYRSVINLGYIFEYGRTGDPDYRRAYDFYALAAALHPDSEAVYKLGDMYTRGRGIARDIRRGYDLYLRSMELAEDFVEEANPALRLANLLVNIENNLYNIEYNPLKALQLYQKAEIGLRIQVAQGETYYGKQLAEAVEGQKKARALVEESSDEVLFG